MKGTITLCFLFMLRKEKKRGFKIIGDLKGLFVGILFRREKAHAVMAFAACRHTLSKTT